ncbi:WD repeat-containing protein 23 [Oopsacas minuta]|uniref:WD repeat-containing protein 23 n=1 Tax=Oopsacas minuta TaxID=111878 RepID=A0AAV7JIV9_9METZ|nr:WD repeat-containing protein 23 [Oopsacas minuta]
MSDLESDEEDERRFLLRFLRLRQQSEFSSPDNEILQHSISEYCYRVSENDITNSTLQGSELFLSCRGWSPDRTSFYSKLRRREFQSSHLSLKSMQSYTEKRIPNTVGFSFKNNSRIYVSQYSQDGTIFYVATQDGDITLYSVPTFTPIKYIQACEVGWAVISCSLNMTNNLLAYSTWSPCVYLYHIDDPACTPFLINLGPTHKSFAIFDTTFSADSSVIAATCSDGCVYLCDVERRIRTHRVVAHEDHANACVFLDQSCHLLISGGEDGLIRLWDTRHIAGILDDPVATFPGHIDSITSLDARFDERYFISNSKDQTIKLWDVRKPGDGRTVERTKTVVSRQNWDYRWEDPPEFLAQMRLYGDTSICSYTGHRVQTTLIRARFSPQHTTASKYIYTGSHGGRRDSKAHIYDMLTGELVAKIGSHSSLIRDVSWHPYHLWLNTSSWDGTWLQWKYVPDV